MKSMIDVSIIIVNFNTCQVTKNCIDSIFEYTKDVNFEIILVDNNSNDDSYSHFTKDNRITYLYQDKNWGFGKANNIGYKHAKGKYLFLLNSDTLLKNNAVKDFFDFLENTTLNIACVGTMLKDINCEYTTSYNTFPTLWTGFDWFTLIGPILRKIKIIGDNNDIAINNLQEVDFVSGADIFMSKEIADKYKLFDPDFFMYFEETEMQYRYKEKGYKNYIYPKPQIIHLESYSVNTTNSGKHLRKLGMSLISYYSYLYKCKGKILYYIFRSIYALVSPLWIIHPKYSLKDKINFIKIAYIKR